MSVIPVVNDAVFDFVSVWWAGNVCMVCCMVMLGFLKNHQWPYLA